MTAQLLDLHQPKTLAPEVFISYARRDRELVQWIEIFDYPVSRWLPRLERALALAGVATAAHPTESSTSVPTAFAKQKTPSLPSPQTRVDLSSLRALAGFNDCLWPIAAEHLPTGHRLRPTFRGLGAPQKEAHHEYKIGSRLGV